jgi:hypothetical protein
MHAAAADDVLTILPLPEQALDNTAGDLAEVKSLLGSAREVARRGGTGDVNGYVNGDAPDRLPSIHDLLNMTHAQREASRRARDARMLAVEAYHAMELCCDCLLNIRLLLGDPATLHPGVDDDIQRERVQGYEHLVRSKEKVDACAALAARALQDLSAAAD